MAKKSKMPTDVNQRAKRIVDLATGSEEVEDQDENRRGTAGGRAGGPARASKLSQKERSEIARKAADARWNPDR